MPNNVCFCLWLWSWNAISRVKQKQTWIKITFQKIAGLSVVQPSRKKTVKHKFILLFKAPPYRKHCRTALERWMRQDPPLWASNVNMLPLHHYYLTIWHIEVFWSNVLWLEVNSNGGVENHVSTTSIINRSSVLQMDWWSILKHQDKHEDKHLVTRLPASSWLSTDSGPLTNTCHKPDQNTCALQSMIAKHLCKDEAVHQPRDG